MQHLEEQKYDVIVTSIGVNDVTKLTSAKSWIKQQKQLFEHIQKRFQPKLIIVSGVPQCNISGFTESTSLVVWAICRANESKLQQWLAPQSHFKFLEYNIETFQAMNLPMASDGFHPSKEVYAVWGRQVAALVRQSLNS